MSPVERFRSAAGDCLRRAYRRWLAPSLAASVAVHVIVLVFFVAPVERLIGERPDETIVIPTVEPIPPPPREPLRPAEPTVASAEIDKEITMEVTDLMEIEGVSVGPEEPRLELPSEPENEFVVYTKAPRCRAHCEPQAILKHLPPLLRRSGVACRLVMGMRIDTAGRVTSTRILRSSSNEACDRAVEEWARTTRWTTAYNRDVPVAVWIAQPIEVRTD